MRVVVMMLCGLAISLGCARVQVQAPKQPIKVDISMRLDVYQHMENDINAIEDIVSGGKPAAKPKAPDKQSWLSGFVGTAYAEQGLSPDVEQAALRRKDRVGQLNEWLAKGVLGENRLGLVENRKPQDADASVKALVAQENNDRLVIYKALAMKNGTSLEEVQQLYAKRLQANAQPGTPIELPSAGGAAVWRVKE